MKRRRGPQPVVSLTQGSFGVYAQPRALATGIRRRQDKSLDDRLITNGKPMANESAAHQDEQLREELADAVEYHKASSDILRIIKDGSSNRQSVFNAIVQTGERLIPDSDFSIALADGEQVQAVAFASTNPEHAAIWKTRFPHPLNREYFHGEAILDCKVVDVPDVHEVAEIQAAGMQNMLGSPYRANTLIPLIRDEKAIGAIAVPRTRPGALSERQLALLHTFADQAVIAIENSTLLDELKTNQKELSESLEHQTATSAVLAAIAKSPGKLQPVFDEIVERASSLCEADYAFLFEHVEGNLKVVASVRVSDLFVEVSSIPLDPGTAIGRAFIEKRTVHIEDLLEWKEYTRHDIQKVGGNRSVLTVPLMHGDVPFGVLALMRKTVRVFSDRQIQLAETFADQAVIAIEDARLLAELASKTEELSNLNESLEARVEKQASELNRSLQLRNFLPEKIAEAVLSDDGADLLKSHRRNIAAVFCDLRRFTSFSESAEPEEVILVLQQFHAETSRLVAEHSGTIVTRMGDGVLIVLNDPIPIDEPVIQALELGDELRSSLRALSQQWQEYEFDVGFGIGISYGYATLGTVGADSYQNYTAIGTVVNVASRLSDMADDDEVLVTQRVKTEAGDRFEFGLKDKLALKGITRAINVFSFVGPYKPTQND